MSLRTRSIAALGAVALCGSAAVAISSTTAVAQNRTTISLAVPAYFNDDALWDRVLKTPQVKYVIGSPATPANGKYVAEKVLEDHLTAAKAKGMTTLVYVTAGYDKVTWQTVADRIDSALAAYPSADGVFLDEINYNQCEKYTSLSKGDSATKGVRARHANKLVVLNPGAPMLNCYEGLADGYLNLERAQADVPAWEDNVNLSGNVPFFAWMFTEVNRPKIWQMVHSVATNQIAAAVDGALSRNASVLFITPDVLPNPYDELPDEASWKALTDRVDAYNTGKLAAPVVKGPKLQSTPTPSTAVPTAKAVPTTAKPRPAVKLKPKPKTKRR
jgi:hypothetical protein